MTLEEKLKWYEQPHIIKAIAKGMAIEDKDMPSEAWKYYSLPFTEKTEYKNAPSR